MHPMVFTKETDQLDADGKPIVEEWIRVPIAKSGTRGKEEYAELCLSRLDQDTFSQFVFEGAKKAMNAAMTKVSKGDKAAAMAKAEENAEKCYTGKIRITGGRAKSGESQQVLALAKAIAKRKLKIQARRKGVGKDGRPIKISLVAESTWNRLALKHLESEAGKALIAEAKRQVEADERADAEISLDGLVEDPKLAQAAAARKKERKSTRLGADDEAELLAEMASVPQAKKGQQPQARH